MGLIDAVWNGVQNLFGVGATKDTNKTNLALTRETNAQNERLFHENNAFQEYMNDKNNAFNKQSAIDMFNMENAYNSPANQKRLLLEAGMNPATMYGAGGNTFMSDASTPQSGGSGVSTSPPTMVAPHMEAPQGIISSLFEPLVALTGAFKNLADSKLSSSQKNRIDTLLSAEFDNLIQQNESLQINNEWNNLKLSVDKLYLKKSAKQELQKLMSEVYKNYAEGGAAHALVALREMQTKVADQSFKMNEEQRPYLLANLKKLGELYDQQVETEKTKQSVNVAQAAKTMTDKTMQDIINKSLPDSLARDIKEKEINILLKIVKEAAPSNKYEFINQCLKAGVNQDAADKIYDGLEEYAKKYRP